MTRTILMVGLLAAITILLVPQTVSANQDTNTDVSVWDSTVSFDLSSGIIPIGGSGQVPGAFTVDTFEKKDTAIQVGLRAQERGIGTLEPIDNVYFAPMGMDPSNPTRASWNFDWSLDFGTSDIAQGDLETQLDKNLTALNMKNFEIILEITNQDGNVVSNFNLNDVVDLVYATPENVVLYQQSWNTQFSFINLPQPESGEPSVSYDIALVVSNDKGKKIAESDITVVITDDVPEDGKINICHKDKKTINVSVNAITAHLKHGDTIGACTS